LFVSASWHLLPVADVLLAVRRRHSHSGAGPLRLLHRLLLLHSSALHPRLSGIGLLTFSLFSFLLQSPHVASSRFAFA
jgi:hypothetical protein